MSVVFELPKIEEAIKRLDALFAEAFSSNDGAMQDWVSVRFFLNAQNTSPNSDYTKCPKCGSEEYKQVTKLNNECLDCGVIYQHFAESQNVR